MEADRGMVPGRKPTSRGRKKQIYTKKRISSALIDPNNLGVFSEGRMCYFIFYSTFN